MKQVFPFKIYSIFLLLLIPILGVGQFTAEKVNNETVDVAEGAEFKVENKYGDIEITGWDQPSISVMSRITVSKKDRRDAEELLDRISVNVSNFGKFVSLNTEISEKNTGFLGRLLAEVVDLEIELSKSDIQIDLEINLPSSIDLEIINSFGDVVVADWSGTLRSVIRHGDLHVAENFERARIEHSFGKIIFQNINDADIKLKSGRLKGDSISDLRLDSHGSELDVNGIAFLDITSSKDELRFDEVGRVKGSLRFGNAFFEVVTEEIYLDLWFADLRINKLTATHPKVFIKQQHSDVDVNISQTAFELDAEMEGGIFRIPESISHIESQMLNEKNNLRKISGKYGAVKTGKITLEGKKGFVIFREL